MLLGRRLLISSEITSFRLKLSSLALFLHMTAALYGPALSTKTTSVQSLQAFGLNNRYASCFILSVRTSLFFPADIAKLSVKLN